MSQFEVAKQLSSEIQGFMDGYDYKNASVNDLILIKKKNMKPKWIFEGDAKIRTRSVYEYFAPTQIAEKVKELHLLRKGFEGDREFRFDLCDNVYITRKTIFKGKVKNVGRFGIKGMPKQAKFAPGQEVSHFMLGVGTVVEIEGDTTTVDFGEGTGLKKLVSEYLTIVE